PTLPSLPFFTTPSTTYLFTLSLHDALPIYFYRLESETGIKLQDLRQLVPATAVRGAAVPKHLRVPFAVSLQGEFPKVMNFLRRLDRKSTRLNSSHVKISYAVFCLKKKNDNQ